MERSSNTGKPAAIGVRECRRSTDGGGGREGHSRPSDESVRVSEVAEWLNLPDSGNEAEEGDGAAPVGNDGAAVAFASRGGEPARIGTASMVSRAAAHDRDVLPAGCAFDNDWPRMDEHGYRDRAHASRDNHDDDDDGDSGNGTGDGGGDGGGSYDISDFSDVFAGVIASFETGDIDGSGDDIGSTLRTAGLADGRFAAGGGLGDSDFNRNAPACRADERRGGTVSDLLLGAQPALPSAAAAAAPRLNGNAARRDRDEQAQAQTQLHRRRNPPFEPPPPVMVPSPRPPQQSHPRPQRPPPWQQRPPTAPLDQLPTSVSLRELLAGLVSRVDLGTRQQLLETHNQFKAGDITVEHLVLKIRQHVQHQTLVDVATALSGAQITYRDYSEYYLDGAAAAATARDGDNESSVSDDHSSMATATTTRSDSTSTDSTGGYNGGGDDDDDDEVGSRPARRRVRKEAWSRVEHLIFLKGLSVFGRGKWKQIADAMPKRSVKQVASHAKKFFLRQKRDVADKRVRSIHDLVLDSPEMRELEYGLEHGLIENPGFDLAAVGIVQQIRAHFCPASPAAVAAAAARAAAAAQTPRSASLSMSAASPASARRHTYHLPPPSPSPQQQQQQQYHSTDAYYGYGSASLPGRVAGPLGRRSPTHYRHWSDEATATATAATAANNYDASRMIEGEYDHGDRGDSNGVAHDSRRHNGGSGGVDCSRQFSLATSLLLQHHRSNKNVGGCSGRDDNADDPEVHDREMRLQKLEHTAILLRSTLGTLRTRMYVSDPRGC